MNASATVWSTMNTEETKRKLMTPRIKTKRMEVIMGKSTEDLLNQREAAEMLNISLSTLRRWRIAGIRPNYIRLGRSIRYDKAELSEVIRERSTTWTLYPQ